MKERTNLSERYFGEMVDRENLPHVFEFSNEEIFENVCEPDCLPVVNCCSNFITAEDVIDEDMDVEAEVDKRLIKSYKKQARKERKKREKIERKKKKGKVLSTRKKPDRQEFVVNKTFATVANVNATNNIIFYESGNCQMEEDFVELAPAYPYKEGIKARYRH